MVGGKRWLVAPHRLALAVMTMHLWHDNGGRSVLWMAGNGERRKEGDPLLRFISALNFPSQT